MEFKIERKPFAIETLRSYPELYDFEVVTITNTTTGRYMTTFYSPNISESCYNRWIEKFKNALR